MLIVPAGGVSSSCFSLSIIVASVSNNLLNCFRFSHFDDQMIASSGFFKDIYCPFLKVGFCERAHCHFSHDKPKQSESAEESEPVYIPTPIPKTKSGKTSATKRSISASSDPIYEPTPISELKKLKGDEKEVKESTTTGKDGRKSSIKPIEVDIFAIGGKSKKDSKHEKPKRKKSRSNSDEKEGSETQSKSNEKHRKVSISPEKLDPKPGSKKTSDLRKDKIDEISTHVVTGSETPSSSIGKVRIGCDTSRQATAVANNKKLTAKEIMLQRFQSVQQSKISGNDDNTGSIDLKAPAKRVAHSSKLSLACSQEKTTAAVVQRPKMPLNVTTAAKIPIITRQHALNRLIDECLKFYDSPAEAYDRGLKEEKSIYDRVKSKMMYPNATASTILKLREEAKTIKPESGNQSPSKSPTKTMSHEQMLNGPNFVNCSVQKKKKSFDLLELPDIFIYDFFKKFLMKEDDLKTYGYPFPDSTSPGKAILLKLDSKIWNDFKELIRVCCRCKKRFKVSEEGIPINKKDTCVYHGGRIWSERSHGTVTKIYSCCKQEVSAGGCCSSDFHVVDGAGHPEYELRFVQTQSKKLSSKESAGIYALDCEMCNTTIGMELTRVSVVDVHCKIVYESLVKPKNQILDYNTKFSGIKKGDLDNVKVTREDVQNKLLELFNDKTILIGHSLESDLKALKLIHHTVIDTAQVFPHRRGLPFKRALRTIVAEMCREIIQDDAKGHDSIEDASSCMRLMIMKATDVMNKFKNQPALIEAVENEKKRQLST